MKLKLFFLSLAVSLLLAAPVQAEDDFQYWSWYLVKVIDTEKIDLSMYADARFYNDLKDEGLYLISPKIQYNFFDNVSFSTNYTYLNYRSTNALSGDAEFKYQHRAELEVNPHFKINDYISFHNRNRLEFRWIEDKGSYNTRSRHRFAFSFPLKDSKFLKKIYTNSEIFYNYAEHTYDENRTVPIGLSFKLNDKTSLDTFYMIQFKKGSTDWKSNEILGTMLKLKF